MSQASTEGGQPHEEVTVRCPVEGCESVHLRRSLHLHVNRKGGEGHGAPGEIPNHLDLKNAEVVGTKEVTVDYPDERKREKIERQCPFCGIPFRGKQGLEIHFGQVVGRKNHPDKREDFPDAEECPIVKVDQHKNIIEVIEEGEADPDLAPGMGRETDETVIEFISRLRAKGETEKADAVEQALASV